MSKYDGITKEGFFETLDMDKIEDAVERLKYLSNYADFSDRLLKQDQYQKQEISQLKEANEELEIQLKDKDEIIADLKAKIKRYYRGY